MSDDDSLTAVIGALGVALTLGGILSGSIWGIVNVVRYYSVGAAIGVVILTGLLLIGLAILSERVYDD